MHSLPWYSCEPAFCMWKHVNLNPTGSLSCECCLWPQFACLNIVFCSRCSVNCDSYTSKALLAVGKAHAHYTWQCVHNCNQFCWEDVLLLPDENKTYHLKDVFLKFAITNIHAYFCVQAQFRGCVQYLGTCQCTCMQDVGCHATNSTLSSRCPRCSALKVERETACWEVVALEWGDDARNGIPTVPMVNTPRPAGKWDVFTVVPTISSIWLLSVPVLVPLAADIIITLFAQDLKDTESSSI